MNKIEALSCRRVSILAQARHSVTGASDFFIKVVVRNQSGHTLDSNPPYPIQLSYHWLDPSTDNPVLFEGTRTPLGPPLPANQEHQYNLRVGPPPHPGVWKLRVTLLQEWIQWFDDRGIGVYADCMVEVLPFTPATGTDHPPVLQVNGDPNHYLMIGCLNTEGTGGLYSWNGQNLDRLDPLATASVTMFGNQLARLHGSDAEDDALLLSYTQDGLNWIRRLPGHGDAHFLAEHQGRLLCVSTSRNSLIWLDKSGEQVCEWKAPGEGDAHHLNSVYVEGDRVFVSAFGRFTTHREWSGRAKDGMGVIFDLETNCDVLSGLCAPHNPIIVDNRWVVCNSEAGELLYFDSDSKELECRLALGGWTRGIAVTDHYILVGISAQRHLAASPDERSAIVVVDRVRRAVVDRLHIPALEIGGLCVVTPEIEKGCRKGWQFLCRTLYGEE